MTSEVVKIPEFRKIPEKSHACALTGQKARKVPFVWTNTHQEVFEKLVTIMTTAPVMRIPNKTDLFILDVDASNIAIGAELLQLSDGEEYVVAYASFSHTNTKKVLHYQKRVVSNSPIYTTF